MILKSFKTIFKKSFEHKCKIYQPSAQKQSINIWIKYMITVFNAVDNKRLNLIGPNLTCAEWLLRNGATLRFKGQTEFLSDYNVLINLEETQESAHFEIEEIFAKDAGLSDVGFDHFKKCNQIQKITLILCSFINNKCLQKLSLVKDSLKYLEINSCFNVEDKGIISLSELSNLKKLTLVNLPSVKNKEKCVFTLKSALKNCQFDFQI